MVAAVRFDHVSRHFGAVRAVDDISLEIADGELFAIDNTCTHRGGPLSEGELSGYAVTCPWHGATFDVRTGEVTKTPASESVGCYSVRVSGDDIEIEV